MTVLHIITRGFTVLSVLCLCLLSLSAAAPAQEWILGVEEEIDRVNYAFAAYLGSGIYTASDGAIQVYSIPLSWSLREPSGERRPGIKLKFPVTFGFYDFKALDLVEGDLPDSVSTVSIIPGAEFRFPVRENWDLTPFADLGAGYDFSGGETTWIWSTGLQSEARFTKNHLETTLGNNLQYAGYTVPGEDNQGSFLVLETGLDLLYPLRISKSGRTNRFSLYLMNQAYLDELELIRYRQDTLDIRFQYEVGITYVPHREFDLWLLDISRIGLGYRFGQDLAAFRLVFGMPF